MAEQFLTLMADLDEDTQIRMSAWYTALQNVGFTGKQTPGLPYHISLATFSTDEEAMAVETMHHAAAMFSAVEVHISHIGIFPGGKVLFGAPEVNLSLTALHKACCIHTESPHPWTPHVTLLIEEPENICAAVPVLVKSFYPFIGRITRLHLCAFWPTREIASAALTGNR